MARALGSLTLQLQADVKRLEKDLTRANSRVKTMESNMRRSVRGINSALSSIGAGISIAAFASITKQAIEFGDQVQKTALRTGLTTEAISELSFVAERGGSSLDAIIKSTQRVQRAAIDASDGLKTYTRAFDRLGIDVEAFKNLAPDRQFEVVADRIASIENPTERTAVAMQLLGRQGAELISVFAGGTGEIAALRERARELGLSLSQDTADRAAEAADRLTDLKASIKGTSLTVAGDMLPAVSALAGGFQTVLLPTIATVTEGFVNMGQFIGGVAAAILNDGLTIKDVFEDLQNRFDNLKPPEAIKIGEAFQLPGDTARLGEGQSNAAESAKKKGRSAADVSAGVITALREELALSAAITEEEKFRVGLTQGRFKQLVETDKALGIQLANEIKANEAIAEKRQAFIEQEREREDLAASVIAGLERQVATYDLTTEAARVRFELEEGAYKSLDAASKQRIDNLARELDGMEAAKTAAEELAKQQEDAAKNAAARAAEFGNTFASALEDAVVEGKKFSDVLKGLEQDLIRIIARQAVTVPLQNAIGGLFDGDAGGGLLSKLFGGPKAAGGPVSAGKTYLVGERGPELFKPPTSGSIVPNHQLAGAGGMEVHVHVTGVTDADSFRRNESQIAASLHRAAALASTRNS